MIVSIIFNMEVLFDDLEVVVVVFINVVVGIVVVMG